jgi:hypothetical protein
MPWHYQDIQTHKYKKCKGGKGQHLNNTSGKNWLAIQQECQQTWNAISKLWTYPAMLIMILWPHVLSWTTIWTCKATIWFHEVNNTIRMTPGCIYLLNKSGQTWQRRPCQSTNTTIFQNLSSIGHRWSVCVEDGQSDARLIQVSIGVHPLLSGCGTKLPPSDDHFCFTPWAVGDICPQGGPGFAFGTLTLKFLAPHTLV